MVLAPIVLSVGCITVTMPDGKPLWSMVHEKKEPEPEKPVVKEPPPPVSEEQVNDTNAPQMADALAAELDHAEGRPDGTTSTAASPDGTAPDSAAPAPPRSGRKYPIR